MKSVFLLATVCSLSILGLSSAYSQDVLQDPAQNPTQTFLTAAAQSDEFEVAEGRLAERLGSGPVRAMGAQMVHDHSMTTHDLHRAITRAGMPVPPPVPLRADQYEMISQLGMLSGPAFNQAYVNQQVMAHRQALAVVGAYARHGMVTPIRQAARMTVPIVTRHLRMFERLAAATPGSAT